jgi:hypothetical protein
MPRLFGLENLQLCCELADVCRPEGCEGLEVRGRWCQGKDGVDGCVL